MAVTSKRKLTPLSWRTKNKVFKRSWVLGKIIKVILEWLFWWPKKLQREIALHSRWKQSGWVNNKWGVQVATFHFSLPAGLVGLLSRQNSGFFLFCFISSCLEMGDCWSAVKASLWWLCQMFSKRSWGLFLAMVDGNQLRSASRQSTANVKMADTAVE